MEPNDQQTREEYFEEFYSEVFEKYLTTKYEKPTGPGHPRLFPTPKDLAKVAKKYFVQASLRNDSFRITAFLIKSKIIYRHIFDDYKKYTKDFNELVIIIKSLIEDYNVEQLYSANYPGSRFILQCGFNNYVPTERQVIEQKDFRVNINSNKVTGDKEDDERGSDKIQED